MIARIAAVALIGLLQGSVALAQDGGFKSELERVAGASPQEKVSYVQSAVTEIDDAYAAVDAMLARAKEGNDSKAIQCVGPRHTAVKALQAVSQQAGRDMVAAVAAKNFDRSDHEFRKIAVAVQRTRMLHAEAERCVGGQELADGETSIQIHGEDDDVAFEDSGLDIDATDIGFDPPDVSPFR